MSDLYIYIYIDRYINYYKQRQSVKLSFLLKTDKEKEQHVNDIVKSESYKIPKTAYQKGEDSLCYCKYKQKASQISALLKCRQNQKENQIQPNVTY